jgi:hypothetical protein
MIGMKMEKRKIRYGVVNYVLREEYEKEWHLPFGYEYITYNEQDAINYCREQRYDTFIVEMIYDTEKGNNFKEEIYRSQ